MGYLENMIGARKTTYRTTFINDLNETRVVGQDFAADDRANRKAGRLGNDRPSLGARLGVGYRSLGVCGKGASMSGLGSRRRTI